MYPYHLFGYDDPSSCIRCGSHRNLRWDKKLMWWICEECILELCELQDKAREEPEVHPDPQEYLIDERTNQEE